jgi:hypothetical protein
MKRVQHDDAIDDDDDDDLLFLLAAEPGARICVRNCYDLMMS